MISINCLIYILSRQMKKNEKGEMTMKVNLSMYQTDNH